MRNKEILDKRILIFDGAMGTYFASKVPDFGQPCEMANLLEADIVKQIHKEYIVEGCDAIKTNTFSVNPYNSTFADDYKEIITAGCKLAKGAVAEASYDSSTDIIEIFGDIGPVSGADVEETIEAYKSVVDAFIENGINDFLFETLSSDEGIAEVASYIKSKTDGCIIVSFAVQPDGYTRDGKYYMDIFKRMKACPDVDIVGLNCVSGVLHMKALIAEADTEGMRISMMPNAGYPRVAGNRTFYDNDPIYFADQIADIAEYGISVIGGCCGTTPVFIRMIKERIFSSNILSKIDTTNSPTTDFVNIKNNEKSTIRSADYSTGVTAYGKDNDQQRQVLLESDINNRFWNRVKSGKKVIAVELDPPRKVDGTKFMSGAWALKSAGADAITIADCATARASMDSSIMACKLRRELDIDVIPHMTCRDRNLNATKALLLGLSMEGVRNVLVVTGDPIPSAERDEVKSVYQFNSRKLAGFISSLNKTELEKPFQIYGALNINAKNFDIQLKLAEQKIKNGMCGFLTQPVLTENALNNLKKARANLDAMIFGGIIPVVSSRNARFMNSEISGITVDERIIELYEGKTKAQCTELAIKISTEIATLIYNFVDGFYLMTPFTRTDIMSELIKNIRSMG